MMIADDQIQAQGIREEWINVIRKNFAIQV
jgi:hypothetical protein